MELENSSVAVDVGEVLPRPQKDGGSSTRRESAYERFPATRRRQHRRPSGSVQPFLNATPLRRPRYLITRFTHSSPISESRGTSPPGRYTRAPRECIKCILIACCGIGERFFHRLHTSDDARVFVTTARARRDARARPFFSFSRVSHTARRRHDVANGAAASFGRTRRLASKPPISPSVATTRAIPDVVVRGASDWSYPRRIAPISQDAIMKKRQTAIEEAYAAQVRPRASPDRARGPFPLSRLGTSARTHPGSVTFRLPDAQWDDGKGSHHPDYDPRADGTNVLKASRETEELFNAIVKVRPLPRPLGRPEYRSSRRRGKENRRASGTTPRKAPVAASPNRSPRPDPYPDPRAPPRIAPQNDVRLIYKKIEEGADVNFVFGNAYGCPRGTPRLMSACNRGRLDAAKALLRSGADPNFMNAGATSRSSGPSTGVRSSSNSSSITASISTRARQRIGPRARTRERWVNTDSPPRRVSTRRTCSSITARRSMEAGRRRSGFARRGRVSIRPPRTSVAIAEATRRNRNTRDCERDQKRDSTCTRPVSHLTVQGLPSMVAVEDITIKEDST